ncbi:MAG: aminotransferase class I/II-fold pyridoxal phosphate-dependent enzyme [Thaumarchaeota archaeon]|nr:aminotransferase class I/II-fold pyridoxal phosphate-dependent enzyme [Nitrososphaerota archaeon]
MARDSTRSVHEAEPFDEQSGSVVTPIYQTSTFAFSKAEDARKAVTGESGRYVYSRWDNPTTVRLEKKLAAFEGTEDAAFFSSGMAAISTSVLTFLKAGDHVVAISDLYGGTFQLMDKILPNFGVKTTLVETTNEKAMRDAIREDTKMVYVESPTNPTLKLVDIRKAAKLAHGAGALLLVDNTFASPINQKPVEQGADVSLHSATKYLNGHADVTAGAAASDREKVDKIKHMRRDLGGTLDPHAAWLVLRGMKTMALRVKAQNENAMALAEFLSAHPRVKVVHYPGLEDHPQHALANKQMKGYGGMMSFELKGTMKDAMRLTERLKVVFLAASLGGVETLVSQPSIMTHTQLTRAQRAKTGIPEALIRLSVGIEDKEDLVEDFRQALASR